VSDYLIRHLERCCVGIRDPSEIAAPHGAGGELDQRAPTSASATRPATTTAVCIWSSCLSRRTPTTHASIVERDDIQVGLNRRLADATGRVAGFVTA
jgi:hypothetical protein